MAHYFTDANGNPIKVAGNYNPKDVMGVPSNNNWISISVTNGTELQYTAPSNGFLTIAAQPKSTSLSRVTLLNVPNFGSYYGFKLGSGEISYNNSSTTLFATCPCKKGDNIRILTTNVTDIYCHFVPCEV